MFTKYERLWSPLVLLAGFGALLTFNGPLREGLSSVQHFTWFDEQVLAPVFKAWRKAFGKPFVYPMIALILFLEYRYPARRAQKTFSVGFTHDIFWFMAQLSIAATLTAGYVAF